MTALIVNKEEEEQWKASHSLKISIWGKLWPLRKYWEHLY